MNSRKLLCNPSQIIAVDTHGKNFKRGKELNEINPFKDHSILIEDDKIVDIIPNSYLNKISYDISLDLNGKTILPGFVECHTHSVFTGSRTDEFRQKLAGINYETIAKSGGGINSTVKSVRNSSFEEIVEATKPRIDNFIAQGITTLEIKSGYGLDFENEIKLLQVINLLNEIYPINIIPTFLGAHTFPAEMKDKKSDYVNLIINKMLPHIAKQKLAVFCDGFCELTAFSSNEIDLIFTTASELGFKLKLHTEQFNTIGGLDIALKHNATTVDHLEVIKEEDVPKLSNTETVGVLLPGVSFFLNHKYAPARKLIDSNAIIALATDYNPGSSHISNLHLIMSLAALKMGMTIEETINAVTINAAKALGLEEKVGSIEIGKEADFSIINSEEYADVVYNIGQNMNCITIKRGNIIYNSTDLKFT